MTFDKLLTSHSFNKTLVFGYYGGGNYGDELLLSVIVQLLTKQNTDIEYAYMNRAMHTLLQHSYSATPRFGKIEILKSVGRSQNILVGGGGHWGLDANPTVLMLSLLLFFSRYVLRKNVYLVGVGYYSSTSKLGHLSAAIAGRAATIILARDSESYANFQKITPRKTYLDQDIAFTIPNLDLQTKNILDGEITMNNSRNILIATRNFRGDTAKRYETSLETIIKNSPSISFILVQFEPAAVDQRGFDFIKALTKKYPHIQSYSLHHNPLQLVSFFKKHASNTLLIAPQYHAQLTAHLVGMEFLPLAYDNKVEQLHQQLDKKSIPMRDVTTSTLQQFIAA